MNKLMPGDQILAIDGEDVKGAPRDHVINLVRNCRDRVTLVVCQPPLDNVSVEDFRHCLNLPPISTAYLVFVGSFSFSDILISPWCNVIQSSVGNICIITHLARFYCIPTGRHKSMSRPAQEGISHLQDAQDLVRGLGHAQDLVRPADESSLLVPACT